MRRCGLLRVRRVQVVRSTPRNRAIFTGICGFLRADIEAISHLHIGSAQELQISIQEEDVKRILNRYKGITPQAINELKFESDYITFNITDSRLVIPSSSVKGNVRARIELSFRAKEGRVRSCFIRASSPKGIPKVGMQGWRHLRIWKTAQTENRGRPCDYTRGNRVCLVCDLFGTSGLKSLVDFSDFIAEARLDKLDLEYGIRILAAPPGTRFSGSITFSNLRPEELGLILLGMGIQRGRVGRVVLLGRLKYRKRINGYTLGRVRYVLRNLELFKHSEKLNVDDLVLRPGEAAGDQALDRIATKLVSLALDSYGDEFEIVDEVAAVDSLP